MTKDVLKAIRWMIKETEREKMLAEFDEVTKIYINIMYSLVKSYMENPDREQYDLWLFNYPTDEYKESEVEEFTISKKLLNELISMFEDEGFVCDKYTSIMGKMMPNHYIVPADKIKALVNPKRKKK